MMGSMRYAYLGPEGTFTEAAVASLAGSLPGDLEPVPYPSVGATLAAVRSGDAERGVVPVESSVEGIVTATVDDLTSDGDLLIRGETTLPIEFALLARPGTALGDVKTVGGHPQAEAQCRRWLAANLPGREWVPLASNAEAARRAAEGDLDAALAGDFAAARYELAVLAPAVHDRSNAVTRFVVVAPPGELPAPTGSDRTSLAAFLAEDHPGALMEILTEFAVRGVNLTTIQSRPTGDGLGSYFFFIDCEGHIDDARVGEAMMGVRRVCAEVRFLGSYPRSDGGRTQVRPGTSDPEFAEAAAWLGRLRYGRPLPSPRQDGSVAKRSGSQRYGPELRCGGPCSCWSGGRIPGGSALRICSSCARAAICCANSVVWMPWNSPSSQPTSCAWAIRSSDSLGVVSSANGSDSRSSSSTSSGARPSSSSLMEFWWISFSRARLFSSSGAAFTSSRSCLIMLPMRMTLAGCSTISVTDFSVTPPSASSWPPPTAMPLGPTTTTCGLPCSCGLISSLMFPRYRVLSATWRSGGSCRCGRSRP
jgi:prephenate dehydratase